MIPSEISGQCAIQKDAEKCMNAYSRQNEKVSSYKTAKALQYFTHSSFGK